MVCLYLALYDSLGEEQFLADAYHTMRVYYEKGGENFYAIDIPMLDLYQALEKAGKQEWLAKMRECFVRHADRVCAIGADYPQHEVNYEQSIVAPAVIILLEVYLITKDAKYLEEAKRQLVLLEAFNGRQPDARLYEVSIRHWDGFWFGSQERWGDTFPHYWSTLTAIAYQRFALATGDSAYAAKAKRVLEDNLPLFDEKGNGSSAFVFPLTVNGQDAHFADPLANDQDFALAHLLMLFPDMC